MENAKEWYRNRIASGEAELRAIKEKITRISWLRVLAFLLLIGAVVYLRKEENWMIVLGAGVFFLPFLWLMKVHNRLFNRKEWLEMQLDINRKEWQGLENDYSGFDGGKEFIDPEHPYAFDIDLFGEKSLFQAINRTCTSIGKRTLAAWLMKHLTDKEAIERRQEGVKDVSERREFCERFQLTGLIHECKDTDIQEIGKWMEQSGWMKRYPWVKAVCWAVPGINLVLLILGVAGIISLTWVGFSFMGFVIISFGIIRRATSVQEEYNRKLKVLSCYAQLIALSERQEWKAEMIREWMKALKIDGKSPSEALQELSKELSRMDLRNNQLLYVILEGSIFFQLHQIVRIEGWKQKYGRYLAGWLETVGRMDALCSLGVFAFNHPGYQYPVISSEPFCLKARNMGHPLMKETQCVKNDVEIPVKPFFLIVTGANMAGKSTYLRTISTNYLLACNGLPVCCESMEVYPAELVTSLRTSDSLSENESYFFAELKRLKRIIDWLNEGRELFIILDEILKGTNSTDKQKGSFDLMKQLIGLKANGIIATHDLLLGELVNQFPEHIANYCFEADIRNDELSFSYKLRKGIAQNMNACFLMRKMGITIE